MSVARRLLPMQRKLYLNTESNPSFIGKDFDIGWGGILYGYSVYYVLKFCIFPFRFLSS